MLGPFATASHRAPIHQMSLLSHASYSYIAGGVRCPRQRRQRQRQRVTEGTAIAPWNGPNKQTYSLEYFVPSLTSNFCPMYEILAYSYSGYGRIRPDALLVKIGNRKVQCRPTVVLFDFGHYNSSSGIIRLLGHPYSSYNSSK